MLTDIAILHHDLFNHAEGVAQSIMDAMPSMPDEELLETRRRARDLGSLSWRIECQADRETIGRGVKRGDKKLVVEQYATELNVTPKTVYMNAQCADVIDAYCKIHTGVNFGNVGKDLVIASLGTPVPVETLIRLVGKRDADRNYSMRDAKRDVAAMRVKRSDVPLPEGKFQVILADPPWRYDFGNSDNRIIENHYPTMELEDICALNVPSIAAEDSVLFLWTTSPKLEQSFEVVNKWGFRYVTCMVWDKEHIGMGYYFRQQHELLLVCKQGNLPAPEPSRRPPSVLRAARGKHSEKPEELHDLLDCMYPKANKVELFCRSPRPGWVSWGNEIE